MTATTVQAPSNRITGADGIRALAALGVVFHHVFQRLNMDAQDEWLQETQRFLMKGSLGVAAFFVLSGLLLSYPFWKAYFAREAMPSIRHYIKRRAGRIMPGFYASLIVSYIVGLTIFPDAPDAWRRLISGLTFTSGLHWMTFFPSEANGPLWSIGFEVVSYVLMPAVMLGLFALKFRGRLVAWGYWALAIAGVLAVNGWIVRTFIPSDEGRGWQFGITGGGKVWTPDFNVVGFFAVFAAGILAGAFIAQWRHFHDGRRSWAFDGIALVATAGIVWLLWAQRFAGDPDLSLTFQNQPYNFPYFPAAVAVLLCALAFSKVLWRIVDNPVARFTAKVSFGIYIWHYLVLHWIERVINPQFYYFGVDDPWSHLRLLLLTLVLSFAIATLSWYVIERPFVEGKYWWKRSRTS